MKQDLAARVARLERENRFIKLVGLCALVAVGALLLLGRGSQADLPDVIKARSFQVVDENLETRAELSYWPRDGLEHIEELKKQLEDARVHMPGQKEAIIKEIEAVESKGFSVFGLRIHGAGSCSLLGTAYGPPSLLLADGEGSLGVLSPGSLHLTAEDKGRITLGADESSAIRLSRWGSPAGIWLFVTEESSSLFMQDESFQDRARLEVPHTKTAQAGEETETPPPSLMLFDKEGEVIWEAP